MQIGMHHFKRIIFMRRRELMERAGHKQLESLARAGGHGTLALNAVPATGATAAEHK